MEAVADESTIRVLFEADDDAGPAEGARPGRATEAAAAARASRRENSERRAAAPGREPSTPPERQPNLAEQIHAGIGEFADQFGHLPVLGRIAAAAENLTRPMMQLVRAATLLAVLWRNVRPVPASAASEAQRARERVVGARVIGEPPRQYAGRTTATAAAPQAPERPARRTPTPEPFTIDAVALPAPRDNQHQRALPAPRTNLPAIRPPDRSTIPPAPHLGPEGAPGGLPAIPPGGALAAVNGAAPGAEAGAAAGLALGPLIALGLAAGGAVIAIGALATRTQRLAQDLSAYSGVLAAANARAGAAQIQQDVKSARYLGADLARLVDAEKKIGIAVQRILDVLTKAGLETALPAIEAIAAMVTSVANTPSSSGNKLIFHPKWLDGLRKLFEDIGILSEQARKPQGNEEWDLYTLFKQFQVPGENAPDDDHLDKLKRKNVKFKDIGGGEIGGRRRALIP